MKTLLRLLTLLLLTATTAHAQTKVFKAVAEDMEQESEPIIQDNNLVGYLTFTQLEKASADSFNYRLSIMDENLNDIGTVNFRDEKLNLKGVSFDQDVLCLTYIKSNFVGKVYRNGKEFRRDVDNARTALFTQFLNLSGKVIATSTIKMEIKPESDQVWGSSRKVVGNGKLKHAVELKNITGKGFACFYGDDNKNNLVVFNTAGQLIWQKPIKEDVTAVNMLTSGPEVSLLIKTKEEMKEGGFAILSYNVFDSTVYPKFLLKDKKGNSLKPLAFENDPITGKPYVAGMVIDPRRGNKYVAGKDLARSPYCGFFTINLEGHTKKDIKAQFSYWDDGAQSIMDKYGYYAEPREFAYVERAFKDYEGNTIFAASGVVRKTKWGTITAAVITSPLILPPIFLLGTGTHKFAVRDVLLVKQDAAGKLSLATTVPTKRSIYFQGGDAIYFYDPNSYFKLNNSATRTQFLVIDKAKDIDIYNVNQKKVARTILHKDGNNLVAVLPAKEGSIAVREYNTKDKSIRMSIEPL
ncbi:DUF6770 family protein [Puia dinghuensis]|uniref:Uncharacterized protein n=1 Tax=Puia dinghuensis TaxID=1792502 RepID=A0A8J2UHS3_9BACT|nr:DUF6770 family protein [Puia dinghuensis]GGB17483.1 hypothetical protein GCM10011511_46590 [Puia dinghuensis]